MIFTDSACDISPELLKEWGVRALPLSFRFNGEEREYSNYEMTSSEFYGRMREGSVAKTAAVNTASFKKDFLECIEDGYDILYIGFSTGLSTTYNSARLAAEEIKGEYPDARILTVDTLAASAGEGLILYLVKEKKKAGASLEEAYVYAREISGSVSHWFTVDDLVYLKRGGRVSPTLAFVGNLMGIKPVMHVDDHGHLVSHSKARGRRGSIAAMADKYTELGIKPEGDTVFISHADCLSDAELLADMIEKKHGVKVGLITDVGPVIGAHSGPGTLALFFIGKER